MKTNRNKQIIRFKAIKIVKKTTIVFFEKSNGEILSFMATTVVEK